MFLKTTFPGVRQEQDIYVRLIDSVTKQVSKFQSFLVSPFSNGKILETLGKNFLSKQNSEIDPTYLDNCL